ncbi:Endoglucanase precursor [compost metagenome]
MLARALGLEAQQASAFTDVDSGAWYADAVAAVSGAGLVLGRSPEAFAPEHSITREEMAVMVVRTYEYMRGVQAESVTAGAFSDASLIHDWAQEAVGFAAQTGLLQGRGNQQFAPQETVTRAESAQVIFNLLGSVEQ